MQKLFEKASNSEYYNLLDKTPIGAKQVVGSKMSEEQFGKELREPIDELRNLCSLFEGYKQLRDSVFISKAEEYLATWSKIYNPDTSEKGVQISLDQRYFSWVFMETNDCWDALSETGKEAAAAVAWKVLDEEEKFWLTTKNHNNRYSYSILTRMTALGVLEKTGDTTANDKLQQTIEEFFNQVRENVYEDGSSLDFNVRDAVHYQVFNQIAWETSRRYLLEHSINIPFDVSAKLDDSLNFCLKFITGDEKHLEFMNSTHARDKEIHKDKIGKPFDKNSYVARQLLLVLGK